MHPSLEAALAASTESDGVDFKRGFDPKALGEWLELIKDVVAMSNSGGGVILIGLEDDGAPSACDLAEARAVDPADFTNKIYKYTDLHFHEFELILAEKNNAPLLAIVVHGGALPVPFARAGGYAADPGGKNQKTAFAAGTVYFRHGAKSEPGHFDDIRKAFDRLLDVTRKSWMDGIAKIVEAPAGSRVAVLPPEVKQSDSAQAIPIRMVDDPTAGAYYAFRLDKTHPHRAKDVVALVNQRLHPRKTINSHALVCIVRAFDLPRDIRYCYVVSHTSPRYSDLFVDWIVAQFEANPAFFEETKAKYDALQAQKGQAAASPAPPLRAGG